MLNGIKKQEFRKPSKWIKTRLENKSYQFVKFVNGYGKIYPFFICEYRGFKVSKEKHSFKFDGQEVNVEKGDYIIELGRIIDYGNLDNIPFPFEKQTVNEEQQNET